MPKKKRETQEPTLEPRKLESNLILDLPGTKTRLQKGENTLSPKDVGVIQNHKFMQKLLEIGVIKWL